jgi:hypothetical protein
VILATLTKSLIHVNFVLCNLNIPGKSLYETYLEPTHASRDFDVFSWAMTLFRFFPALNGTL